MRRRAICVVTILFAGACIVGCGDDAGKPFAGFEDGIPKGWSGAESKISISDEHATEGAKSLCVEAEAGDYPGFGIEFDNADWSKHRALRFSLFSTLKKTRTVSIRIDDASSKSYGTRFNLEGKNTAPKISPGANEIEIPIASLLQGAPESQGLDVTRIKLMRLWMGGLKAPTTIYVDNFRLIAADENAPKIVVIADFDDASGKVTSAKGTIKSVVDAPEGLKGKSLKVEGTPAASYPGVTFAVPEDWLSYDALSFKVLCPKNTDTPSGLAIKVSAKSGRRQTFNLGLKEGLNEITFPIEIAGFVELGRVAELAIFWGKPATNEVIYIDDVRLEREKLVDYPTQHHAAKADDRLALDYSAVKMGRNTCFMATVWIPLKSGGFRVLRCNSPGRSQKTYGIGADAFKGYAEGKPVRVWTAVLDHGVWPWCETQIVLKPEGRTTLTVEDADFKGQ